MLWATNRINEELEVKNYNEQKLRVLLLGRLIYKFYNNKS
jgi:hypothetical protein